MHDSAARIRWKIVRPVISGRWINLRAYLDHWNDNLRLSAIIRCIIASSQLCGQACRLFLLKRLAICALIFIL